QSGVIKVFASLTATTPTVFADLSTNVYNFWDRGLLGLALDPSFPTRPYVYVLYTYDAPIGGGAPRWGTPGVFSDPCPTPPGPNTDGCVASARLSRLTASGNVATGPEQVLIEDWCQQFPSHSIGTVAFGPDGALYAGAGEAASFGFTDYGADGNPLNPCGDPPAGVGGTETPPTAEGGALRSQDLRTSGDPVTLDGSIVRVDPDTGAALPSNPLALNPDPNARRIVAYGLRNPFRFTFRPGTNEIWIGDVGWNDWEEIDRVANPADTTVENFGWPCYEGNGRQQGFDGANLNLCNNLYSSPGAVTPPFFTYSHAAKVVPGEACPTTGGSSITGSAFYPGGTYPGYTGAFFFADYTRNCIWAMLEGANGSPDPTKITTFASGAAGPVDLQIGPGGDLFYADLNGGTIRRIQYFSSNQPPTAVVSATPTSGPSPLTVSFDGTGSTDPDAGDTLSYSWDLNGDGVFGDSTAAKPTYTYTQRGLYTAGLRVTDSHGASNTRTLVIGVDEGAPRATITTPTSATTWKVGDVINFSGSGTDPQDGTLPASALSWSLILHHCPSACHTHLVQNFVGTASGTFTAPDHDYPSYLELRLTVTDSSGFTDTKSVQLDPLTVPLSFASGPSGLQLVVGSSSTTTPFTRTVIVGSANSVSAPNQALNGTNYAFTSWSDGGPQTHTIVAPATATTYTATFSASGGVPAGLVAAYAFNEGANTTTLDSSGNGNTGTITGAAWTTAGKFGSALSFNGSNSWVTAADANSLDLTNGMTLEAWVNPNALGTSWRTLVFKERPGGLVYSLYANQNTNRPVGQVDIGGERNAVGPAALPLNTWTHLAVTFDGSNLRLYVNGGLVTTTAFTGVIPASTGVLHIGGNSVWGEWYSGLIDEVRIYNRPLAVGEIQADMNTAIGPADTTPPSTPTNFVKTTATAMSIATTWTASTDNSGTVAGYNLYNGTTKVGTTSGRSFTFTGLVCSTPYTLGVEAYDVALNVSAGRAFLVESTLACDTTAPTVSVTAPLAGAIVSGPISVTANAGDNDSVAGVQFKLDGAPLGPEDTVAPYSVTWDTTTATNATHKLTATARDPSSNTTTSAEVAVTVSNVAPPPPTGLVAAYGFNEGVGTTTADVSGKANTGTLTGASWTTAGKFGSALSFNGVNNWVTVADANSLDLTNGMTLEAWVKPSALGTSWRTALFKERPGGIVYSLYANQNTSRPVGQVFIGAERNALGSATLPLNAWTHIAVTFDGANLRFYANGGLTATTAISGSMAASTGVLRIGGNSVWGEWFTGVIDEVRIYNRALSASEITTDSNTAVH
ncbi:MAG: hypothetical protein QOE91_1048, partial [Gaiellaceae bacterium]|nr:hypothetical protein [Gaiellaceae bacterium]